MNSAFFWGTPGEVVDANLDGWKDVYQTNLIGTMQMIQAVAPVMKAQGGGAIVNVSTMASAKPHIGEAGYAASKGAINVASKYLAQELGPSNIRVNVIRMGWMYGRARQAYLAHAAQEQGVPEKQIYDAVAANISAAPHRHRRRVRPGGIVPGIRLCVGRFRGDPGRERRRVHAD